MSVIIVRGDRPEPESVAKLTDPQRLELFRTLVAYSGTYKFDGKTVEHRIDIAWNEVWAGTRQVRTVAVDGDRVSLTTPATPTPGRQNLGEHACLGEGEISSSMSAYGPFRPIAAAQRYVRSQGQPGLINNSLEMSKMTQAV